MGKGKKKDLGKGHPAFMTGIVNFEFWNNDDESYRNRALKDLAKEARAAFNISALPINDETNPEAGQIVFAGAAMNESDAEKLAADVMKFLDEHGQARIIADHWIAEEIPV